LVGFALCLVYYSVDTILRTDSRDHRLPLREKIWRENETNCLLWVDSKFIFAGDICFAGFSHTVSREIKYSDDSFKQFVLDQLCAGLGFAKIAEGV
jgi:hypothetical protein